MQHNYKKMETITKQKTQRKGSSTKEMPERKGSDLTKIYGIGKGKIFYDESIFNLGKRRERV